MAYVKTVWTNGSTALSAEHMNNIENGIETLDTNLNASVTSLEGDVTSLGGRATSLEGRATLLEGRATSLESGKVDKVTGKGLSSNDYTTEEKTKLIGLSDAHIKIFTLDNLSLEIPAKSTRLLTVSLELSNGQQFAGIVEYEFAYAESSSSRIIMAPCISQCTVLASVLTLGLSNWKDTAMSINQAELSIAYIENTMQ